jgi:IS30 family transposase
MKQYSHLSSQERQKIEAWIIAKKTIRWIAQQLQRSPSTISREIKRNKVKKEYN